MKRLVVIGNGFDLAHGLSTKYSDFLEYLSYEKYEAYNKICQYISEESLWSSFENALAELDDEQLQDDNACYLVGYGDDNWSDSYHHDYQYMIEESLSFAKDIPRHFSEWITQVDINTTPLMPQNIISKNNLYLCFNYTNTLEYIYKIPTQHILYIHGQAMRGDPLVVGHHTEGLIKDEQKPHFKTEEEWQEYYENINEDVREAEAREIIKNYFKITYKDTKTIIKNNIEFFNSLNNIEEVIIYGHSLSNIDMDYFYQIRNCVSENTIWKISYRDCWDCKNAYSFVMKLKIKKYEVFSC